MELNKIRPATGSVKKRKRIARGPGSGHGGTSTRGHKGAKSRSGFKSKRGHEGGQMPLQMRLPKRGFQNTHPRYKSYRAAEYVTFNLSDLVAIADKYNINTIDVQTLYSLGLIGKTDHVKILGDGELKGALQVAAHRFSAKAKAAIAAAGGKAFITLKTNQLQGIAEAGNFETVGIKEIAEFLPFVEETDNIYVIAEGSLKTKFNIQVQKVDDAAKDLVQGQGGSVELL